jgi:DNA-directed RNA polymerase specialized sigma24 family protein
VTPTGRAYLRQTVVNKARSARQHQTADGGDSPPATPDPLAAGLAAAGGPDRECWACALRTLPARRREAVVLHTYLGLSARQAAEAMSISTTAARSHLARGLSRLRRQPEPQ